MGTRNLRRLFDPKSIAVIGASNRKGSVGYILLHNLIGADYEGTVYPVSVSTQSIQGIHSYSSIAQVPRKIDLAVIAVPAGAVAETMRECGEAGVGGAVVVSAGFREIGDAGRKL
ncbi:MAG TPA: CoA-binding protein, partial [Thermoleophilia bacterium]|nr:CoA-binding protein [Thermoleophilia bacterium]